MKTVVDDRLRDEAARFSLVHRCDECAHWSGEACSAEWPTAEHRLPIAAAPIVVFCKEFEAS